MRSAPGPGVGTNPPQSPCGKGEVIMNKPRLSNPSDTRRIPILEESDEVWGAFGEGSKDTFQK